MALTPYQVSTPYEGHTLAAEQIANTVIKEEEAKLQTVAKEHLSGQTTELIAPDGKVFSFPVEKLGEAQKMGFRAETPEESAARAYEKENPISAAAGAFARHVVGGATLGVIGDKQIAWVNENIPKWLGGGLTENQLRTQMKAWERQHGAVLVGDLAGMLLTLPVAAGVAGLGAKAAVGSEGLIAAGGARAVAGHAYRGALEGLALSSGQAIREYVNGEGLKTAAETVVWGVGPGAVLGGLGGLAGGARGAAKAPSGSDPLARAWFKSIGDKGPPREALMKASKNIEGAHEAVALWVNEKVPALRRGVGESYTDYSRRYGEWMEALVSKPLPRSEAEFQSLAAEFQSELNVDAKTAAGLVEAKKVIGAPNSEFYELLDEAMNVAIQKDPGELGSSGRPQNKILNEILAARRQKLPIGPKDAGLAEYEASFRGGKVSRIDGFDSERFASRYWREAKAERGSPFLGPIIDSIDNGEVKRWLRAALDIEGRGSVATGDVLPFKKGWQFRQHLDGLVHKAQREGSPRIEELKTLRSVLQEELETQGAEIINVLEKYDERFGRALPELKQAKEAYSKLSAWKAGVDSAAEVEQKARWGLPENSFAVGGALFSAATGSPLPLLGGVAGAWGHRLIRREGHGLIARAMSSMPTIEVSLASMGKRLMEIPKAIEGAMPNAIPAHRIVPIEVLSQWMPNKPKASQPQVVDAPEEPTKADPVKAYVAFANEIAELSANPMALNARIKEIVGPLMAESPSVAMAVAQHYGAIIAHINEIMPKVSRQTTPLSERVDPYVSKTELERFAQRLAIIDDPLVAKQFLATRTLTKEHMETLFKVWPAVYRTMVQGIQEYAASAKGSLDWRGNVQLSLFTGIATVPQMKGKAIAGIQQVYVAEQMGGAPGMQSMGKPTNVKGPDMLTEAQRLGAGRKR